MKSFASMAISIYTLCSCSHFGDSPFEIKYFSFPASKIAASDRDSYGHCQSPNAFLYNDSSMYVITQQSIISSDDFPRNCNTVFSTDSLLFARGYDPFNKEYAVGDNYLYGSISLDDRRTPGILSPRRVFSFDVDSNEMRLSKQTFRGIKSLWLGCEGQLYVLEQGKTLWMIDNNFEAKRIREFSSCSAGGLSDGYWIVEKDRLEIVKNDDTFIFDIPNVEGVLECSNQHLCVICRDSVFREISVFHIINNSLVETYNTISNLKQVSLTHAFSRGNNLVLGLFMPRKGILCSSDGGYTWILCRERIDTDLTMMSFNSGSLWVWEAL